MAEIKISELTSGSALNGTEVVPIVQSGATVKVTTQDIADLGGGANPTSGVIPYNDGGVFADSSIDILIGGGNLKNYSISNPYTSSGFDLQIYPSYSQYSFGSAVANGISVQASAGLSIDGGSGEAIINCAMSSPTNGVFRASSGNGAVWIGNGGINNGIGISNNGTYGDAMLVGSNLTLASGPNLYLMVHIPGVGDKLILLQ